MPQGPSRRAVVAALVAVPGVPALSTLTAGCTLSGSPPRRSPADDEVDPDVVLLREVAAANDAMVALYAAVLRRHRALRDELRLLLSAHRAHAEALGEAAPDAPGPTATSPGRTTGGQDPRRRAGDGAPHRRGRRTPARPEVPAETAAAVRVLRRAEREAAAELLDATGRAASGPFARLLASMSAASAQHVQVLATVGAR